MSWQTINSIPERMAGRMSPGFIFGAAAILWGMALGALALIAPIKYLPFIAGGLIFGYLLIFKIEIAIIVALFAQNFLWQFNYLGEGTPFHPNGIMGIGIILGAAFYLLFHKVNISRLREARWFGLFLVLCILSTLAQLGGNFMEALTLTTRLATALSIFVVMLVKLDSIGKVKWVLGAIIAAQIQPTIDGLLRQTGSTGLSFSDQTLRLGDSGVGVYLSMMVVACLVFLASSKTLPKQLMFGGLTALFGAGLFFSFGRSGWISLLAAVAIIGAIRYRWMLLVAPLVLIIMILLVPGIGERFAEISITAPGASTTTFSQRVEIWEAGLVVSSSSPVFGVGFGSGRLLVGQYLSQYPWMIHNDYLSVLIDLGLTGLAIFLVWNWSWLRGLLRVYRQSVHEFDKTLALAIFAIFAASLVARITDNLLVDSYDMYPLCALIGSVLALPRIRETMETAHV